MLTPSSMLDRDLVIAIFNEAFLESRGDPYLLRDLFIEWVTAMDGMEVYQPSEMPEPVYQPSEMPESGLTPGYMHNRLTDAHKDQIVERYKESGNKSEVARTLGISHMTVSKVLRERGIETVRRRNKPRNVEGPIWADDEYYTY